MEPFGGNVDNLDSEVDTAFLSVPAPILADVLAILAAVASAGLPAPEDMYPTDEQTARLSWSGPGWITSLDVASDRSVKIVATGQGQGPSVVLEYRSCSDLIENISALSPLITDS